MKEFFQNVGNIAVLVALITACGAFVGHVWNTRAERLSNKAELQRRAGALRAVLFAECQKLSEVAKSEIEFIKSESFEETWVTMIFRFKIIEDNPLELGILEPEEAAAVMRAFYEYQERSWYISIHGHSGTSTTLSGPGKPVRFDLTDTGKRDNLINDLMEVAKAADAACTVLAKRIRAANGGTDNLNR